MKSDCKCLLLGVLLCSLILSPSPLYAQDAELDYENYILVTVYPDGGITVGLQGTQSESYSPLMQSARARSSPAEPKYDNIDDIITACAKAMGGVDVIEGIQTLKIAQNWPDHGTLFTEIRRPNMERLGETLVWNCTYCAILGS